RAGLAFAAATADFAIGRAAKISLHFAVHWLGRHRLLILAGICAFVTLVVLALHFATGFPFLSVVWSSEQAYEDVLRREGRKTKKHQDFVFVGIDQASLTLKAEGENEVNEWRNNRAFQL